MAVNFLDFLEAHDRHLRQSPAGEVTTGYEMHQIASDAGLTAHGDVIAASWTGQLVDAGYVEYGAVHGGAATRLIPKGVGWTDGELQTFSGYRLTAAGREEAERVRRSQREQATDAALGRGAFETVEAQLDERSAGVLGHHLRDARAALESERAAAAVGAAKNLVEAACTLVISVRGARPRTRGSLPALFSQAHGCLTEDPGEVGRSMTAAVQRLAERRNAVGAGHGHAEVPAVTMGEARLAVTFAVGTVSYLLSLAEDARAR